jgi:caa(3)-type oxidase subunit IV
MAENQNVLGSVGEGEAAIVEAEHNAHDAHSAHDHHSDSTTVQFAGREITLPVPVYTAVFGVLGALTVIEVLLAEIITSDIKTPILVLLSLMKAGLVVWFYMHLNRDTRLFMLTLLLPVIVGLLSALYLLTVPTGYSY